MLSALLDANVLFPPTLRWTLIRLARVRVFRPLWSPDILDEFRRSTLKSYSDVTDELIDRWITVMGEHFEDPLVDGYGSLVSSVEAHQKDRHVLAAAIHACADVIVTYNVRHFPGDCLDKYGVDIQTPDDFLLERFHERPSQVSAALEEHAEAAEWQLSEFLDALASKKLRLPEFVRAVRKGHYFA